MLAGSGLTAQYFHNVDFTGLAAERVEAVDFAWGTGTPTAGLVGDTFSVRWIGRVEATHTETYTFRTTSDDGVRLWIDGELLIDEWHTSSVRVKSGSIALEAGQFYDVRLEYYDNTGTAQMKLEWLSASQALQAIPAERLYGAPAGLLGAYSDIYGGRASRVDDAIDFNWGVSRPVTGVAIDNFTVEWTGYLRPDFSETYQFRTMSDERVRLWIGDELIIDNWSDHALTADIGVKTLEAGKLYDVRLEYFDKSGHAEIELAWSSARQTAGGEFDVIPASRLHAAQAAELTLTNSLGPGADPYVIQWQGQYLLVRSTGAAVWIDRADRLEDIHSSTPASASVRVWTAPTGTNYSKQVWAPEIHQIDGKWYIYVAASDGDNATHRMHVLERHAADPFGPFVYKGQLTPTTDRWAIDGTVLEWEGQLYFVWSGWPGTTNGQQNLYIAAMSNPWTISGNRVLLSSPAYAWEKHGMAINEGPQILIQDGKLHIIYSGSGYWRHEYALGRLTYNGVGSIMSAASWSKAVAPVFKQSGDIVGTGHASFVKSPDGTENWIVYHAHRDRYNWQDDRDIFIQPFTFNVDGSPNFGTPIPKSTPITVPSGYADADRPLLPGDFDASGTVNAADLTVWKALVGQTIIPGVSADANGDGVIDGGDFLVWQRNFGQQATATVAATAMASPEQRAELQSHVEELPESPSDSLFVAMEKPAVQAAPLIAPTPLLPKVQPLLTAEIVDLAFAAAAFGERELPDETVIAAVMKPVIDDRDSRFALDDWILPTIGRRDVLADFRRTPGVRLVLVDGRAGLERGIDDPPGLFDVILPRK